jgi:endonuclease I/V8-like Glu-specific endopeptidase
MKSINPAEQKALNQRVKRKLKSYINKLDHRPEAILNNPRKAKRVEANLKKRGRSELADELAMVTSKNATESVIIDKMKGYIPDDFNDDVSKKEKASTAKLNVAKVAVEAVQGLSDMVSSRFLYEGANRARTVGRISRSAGPEPIGTGFMISPNLLMTNYHVLESDDEAEGCYVEFDYFHSKDNFRVESEIFILRPDGFYHSNPDYDYAIVMVDAISDQQTKLDKYGWNNLGIGKIEVEPSDRLNIVHHPRGEHQQISIRKNYVVDIENEDIYVDYVTDTDYGSSGSPVYNDEWNVVALHRGHSTIEDGAAKNEFLGNLEEISKDLANEMKDKDVTVNVGVKIDVILDNLRIASADMIKSEQKLIDQIFESPERRDELISSNESINSTPPNSNKENQMNSPISQNITINGGNVTLNLTQGVNEEKVSPQEKNSPKESNGVVNVELYKRSLTTQTSIFKALDYVQKARELPYLPNAQEMERIIEAYYGDIITQIGNMTDADCYDILSAKMQATFKLVDRFPDPLDLDNMVVVESSTPSSYHKARAHIYTRVDLQPDGSLRGIYSGSVIAPEQLMLIDLINSLEDLDYELPKRYKNSDYLNCEHIVPKTYFDRNEDGFSDLHHLITADGTINKFRNKDTYADLGQLGDDGRSSLPVYIPSGGWKKDGHFEPARGKSLVARATLYFIVAHPNFISTQVYSSAQIETLIAWSNSEEPSDYEKHRNQTIYEIQGNRNPFIDFPDWVDKVDFIRGMS